jgi:hypothetical protein
MQSRISVAKCRRVQSWNGPRAFERPARPRRASALTSFLHAGLLTCRGSRPQDAPQSVNAGIARFLCDGDGNALTLIRQCLEGRKKVHRHPQMSFPSFLSPGFMSCKLFQWWKFTVRDGVPKPSRRFATGGGLREDAIPEIDHTCRQCENSSSKGDVRRYDSAHKCRNSLH